MAYQPPRIGAFRDIIRIERQESVSDGMGGTVEGWTTFLDALPAHVAASRGGEEVRAARLGGSAPYDITIRWSPAASSIRASDRVVDIRSGTILDLKWIGNLDGQGRYLVLSCLSGNNIDGSAAAGVL